MAGLFESDQEHLEIGEISSLVQNHIQFISISLFTRNMLSIESGLFVRIICIAMLNMSFIISSAIMSIDQIVSVYQFNRQFGVNSK